MSFATNISNAFTRVGTEFKALRILISGSGTGNTSALDTTATNLVDAINEVLAATGGSPISTLDDLTDVVITSPVTGHVLRHNGTSWVNVVGTTHFDAAGAAAAAQAASQPLDSDLTAIAALSTTSYGRALLEVVNLAALYTVLAVDTDGTLAANSDAKLATQKAVKTYADALIGANNAMVFKGVIDASINPNYPAANAGDTYRISVAGKIGGASGPNVEVGDLIVCLADSTASGNHATVGASWNITQVNIDGAVTGPASSVSADIATFSGTSGKVIQDSGFTASNGAVSGNSGTALTTQAAVVAYSQPLDADLTALAALSSAANKLPYATGSGTWALTDLSAFVRTLLDDADAATARATLSVYSQTEMGDPATDFVAVFEAGLL